MECQPGIKNDTKVVYTYKPLNRQQREIRLLYFQVGSHVDENTPVRCRMVHTFLDEDDKIKFDAISYHWSSDSQYAEIEIDGSTMSVPSRAEKALRETYPLEVYDVANEKSIKSDATENRPVWIDAICIEQNNLEEKGHQVALMADIYSRAENVLIWLEPIGKSTAATVNTLQLLVKQGSECTNEWQDFDHNERLSLEEKQHLPYSSLALPSACDWTAFELFFSAPWFTRVWVIQEVLLARNPIIMRDESSIPWSLIRDAFEWLDHRGFPKNYRNDIRQGHGFYGCRSMAKSKLHPPHKLHGLLAVFANFNCTMPLDRVYGLYGILDQESKASQTSRAKYNLLRDSIGELDYGRCFKEVFTKAVGTASFLENSLLLLRNPLYNDYAIEYDLPSWIPRFWYAFSVPNCAGPLSAYNKADNRISAQIAFDVKEHKIFRVHGIRVGVIVGRNERYFDSMSSDIEPAVQYLNALIQRPELAWSLEMLKTIANILVCGEYPEGIVAANNDHLVPDFCAAMEECCQTLGLSVRSNIPHLLRQHGAGQGDSAAFWKGIRKGRSRGSYFETSNQLHGITGAKITAGDMVTIIFGIEVPLVLRQTDEHWALLGTAYIPDIMAGQYVARLQKDGQLLSAIEEFALC